MTEVQRHPFLAVYKVTFQPAVQQRPCTRPLIEIGEFEKWAAASDGQRYAAQAIGEGTIEKLLVRGDRSALFTIKVIAL